MVSETNRETEMSVKSHDQKLSKGKFEENNKNYVSCREMVGNIILILYGFEGYLPLGDSKAL